MKDRALILMYMNPKSHQRLVLYDKNYLSPTIQAAAGAGGGQAPYVVVVK